MNIISGKEQLTVLFKTSLSLMKKTLLSLLSTMNIHKASSLYFYIFIVLLAWWFRVGVHGVE